MDIANDVHYMLVLYLLLIDTTRENQDERSAGCGDFTCLPLRGLIGHRIVDDFDRLVSNLLDFGDDVSLSVNYMRGS